MPFIWGAASPESAPVADLARGGVAQPGLGREPAVALLAVAEMHAHRLARRAGVLAGDRGADDGVFALEGFEVGALAFRAVRGDPDALPRNDETAEIFEEVRE